MRNKIEDLLLNYKRGHISLEDTMSSIASYQSQQPTADATVEDALEVLHKFLGIGLDENVILSQEQNELHSEVENSLRLFSLSQQPTGPVWVKARKVLPELNKTIPLKINGRYYTGKYKSGHYFITLAGRWNVNEVEWLDESQSAPIKEPTEQDGLDFLKSIGYDNNNITSTEIWIAKEAVKRFSAPIKEDKGQSNIKA